MDFAEDVDVVPSRAERESRDWLFINKEKLGLTKVSVS